VFVVISPDSMASSVARQELDHAVEQHKRLIPIVCRETESELTPVALRRLHWIFFRDVDDFDQALATLVAATPPASILRVARSVVTPACASSGN